MFKNLLLYAQTPANTVIVNQAKAVYKYKTFPNDTLVSTSIQFSVLSSPNFELSFSRRDTNVLAKDTLLIYIVYKNIGNLKADSISIQAALPLSGLRFVPEATNGTISGNAVTWKVSNINPSISDSVVFKVVVDSSLSSGSGLIITSSLNWLSSSVTASQHFIVNSFPRLNITCIPTTLFVGSGRSVTVQIHVHNTGNIIANNTVLVDTISQYGMFQSSSITPDSIKSNGRILIWNLGNIAGQNEKVILLSILTQPNLSHEVLSNMTYAYSTNVPSGTLNEIIVPIVPIVPKSISITTHQQYIFGKLNEDSSKIDIVLKDSANQTLPNGVSVELNTTFGSFANSSKHSTVTMQNGIATAMLYADNVQNLIEKASITITGGTIATGTIVDSTSVFMYPGAIKGKFMNGPDRQPLQGAITRVYNSSKQIVGLDTTDYAGRFFIPLNKDVSLYTLELFTYDKFGDTVLATTTIDPTIFPAKAFNIPNMLSGRLVYKNVGQPVITDGVTMFLDSASNGQSLSIRNKQKIKLSLPQGFGQLSRVQEQKTDWRGRFKFENLRPAKYVFAADSILFPSYKGYTAIIDTTPGTFTLNLALEVTKDSSVFVALARNFVNQTVNAGDTLQYSILIRNTGNSTHHIVTLIDTLPTFTNYVSAVKGIFDSLKYDPTTQIIRWSKDSLQSNEADSLMLRIALSRNIPDSTVIRNAVLFSSDLISNLSSATSTLVRSSAKINFGSFYVKDSSMAGDSLRNFIWFSNTGTDSIRGIRIVDTIYSAGNSKIRIDTAYFSTVSDSIAIINIGTIAPGGSDTIDLTVYTDFNLNTGTVITSSAHLMKDDSSLFNVRASVRLAKNPNISSFLKISKTANKKVAEVGDIVTYQIQISNASPTYIHSIGIYDFLPYAFKYIKNSARLNGKPLEPSFSQTLNQLIWNSIDTLQSGRTGVLVYQLAIGADGLESEGLNTARASALANAGAPLISDISQWQISVKPGVFTEKGLIIGKVFYDDNRNGYQESGEDGIKDVEIWMEDGTKIITGDDGKYSLPEVKPGQHVLRINEPTLPEGVELIGKSNKFAGDPISQFVRLTEGGIAKANFFVKRIVRDSAYQTIGKINKLFATRQAIPKYLYTDSINNIIIDTVEMVVVFTFNCGRYLQSIEINETLPEEFTYIPGSGSFNGRQINPIIYENSVQWNIGRYSQYLQGKLRYKVVLNNFSAMDTTLISSTYVKGITADSSVIVSGKMVTKNIITEKRKNRIETSEVVEKHEQPFLMSDSVICENGDEVYWKTSLYLDKINNVTSIFLIDTLSSEFILNERSYTVNGMPIPIKNISIGTYSKQYSLNRTMNKSEFELMNISSIELTGLLRNGINEITYSTRLLAINHNTVYKKKISVVSENNFTEKSIIASNEVKLYVNTMHRSNQVLVETTFVDVMDDIIFDNSNGLSESRILNALKSGNSYSVVVEGVTFQQGKETLMDDATKVLERVAVTLRKNPTISIKIAAHTDNIGSARLNRKLSLARAKAVRDYLTKQGIEITRITVFGYGADKPIASNKTEEGRSKNRRVEFIIKQDNK